MTATSVAVMSMNHHSGVTLAAPGPLGVSDEGEFSQPASSASTAIKPAALRNGRDVEWRGLGTLRLFRVSRLLNRRPFLPAR
jgi:hypothetical protein